MKEQILEIVYNMYTHLNNQYQSHLQQGNGRTVHDLNAGRTPIAGHLQLMEDAMSEKKLPKDWTYDRIGGLLQLYDRSESKLIKIIDKMGK